MKRQAWAVIQKATRGTMPESIVFNEDCMQGMKRYPEKYFDLAVVDPPYGIEIAEWDKERPTDEYWEQLFRVSKNQIVWGGNYFTSNLYENRCWISWYKGQPINSFSDFELAWTSFNEVCKAVKIESYGFLHSDKKMN